MKNENCRAKKNIGFLYQVVLQPLKMIVLPRPTKNGSKITQSSDSLSTAPQNCPWLTFDRKNLIGKYSFRIHPINILFLGKHCFLNIQIYFILFYKFIFILSFLFTWHFNEVWLCLLKKDPLFFQCLTSSEKIFNHNFVVFLAVCKLFL